MVASTPATFLQRARTALGDRTPPNLRVKLSPRGDAFFSWPGTTKTYRSVPALQRALLDRLDDVALDETVHRFLSTSIVLPSTLAHAHTAFLTSLPPRHFCARDTFIRAATSTSSYKITRGPKKSLDIQRIDEEEEEDVPVDDDLSTMLLRTICVNIRANISHSTCISTLDVRKLYRAYSTDSKDSTNSKADLQPFKAWIANLIDDEDPCTRQALLALISVARFRAAISLSLS